MYVNLVIVLRGFQKFLGAKYSQPRQPFKAWNDSSSKNAWQWVNFCDKFPLSYLFMAPCLFILLPSWCHSLSVQQWNIFSPVTGCWQEGFISLQIKSSTVSFCAWASSIKLLFYGGLTTTSPLSPWLWQNSLWRLFRSQKLGQVPLEPKLEKPFAFLVTP